MNGKTILITGGSKGIGLACARAFAAEGARVAIVSRSEANIERALLQLPNAAGYTADMIDAEAAAHVFATVERDFGAIDVLVNSAGAAKRKSPEELSPAAWRAAMDAKYFSYINIIDPVVKRMAERGSGTIVNVIGAGGKVATTTHIAGGAANAALMLATAGLGAAYASSGVRVVGVNPGLTNTERVTEGLAAEARSTGSSKEEALQRAVARMPLGRLAEPEEIAAVVVFLASARASYLTGTTLSMDGALYPVV